MRLTRSPSCRPCAAAAARGGRARAGVWYELPQHVRTRCIACARLAPRAATRRRPPPPAAPTPTFMGSSAPTFMGSGPAHCTWGVTNTCLRGCRASFFNPSACAGFLILESTTREPHFLFSTSKTSFKTKHVCSYLPCREARAVCVTARDIRASVKNTPVRF